MKKRITIKDIARLAGVSVGAVSTAFSQKNTNVHLSVSTRKKILEIAAKHNYIPNVAARAMQSRKSYLLGFFYRTDNSYLQSGILRGIRSVCRKYDYDIIVYPCDSLEDEKFNLESLHVNSLDGIITIPQMKNGITNEKLYRTLTERGIPVIQVLTDFWSDIPMIGRDYSFIGRSALEMLIGKGHRHIGFMTFSNYTDPENGGSNFLLANTIKETAKKHDVKLDIFTVSADTSKENYISEAAKVVQKILDSAEVRPTALLTAAGLLAYGAYSCFSRNDIKVPDDISLLACGDDCEQFLLSSIQLSYFSVELEEIGISSASRCLDKNADFPLKQFVHAELTEGNTI